MALGKQQEGLRAQNEHAEHAGSDRADQNTRGREVLDDADLRIMLGRNAIREALEMDQAERSQRHIRALTHLRAYDLAHWSQSFLRGIEPMPVFAEPQSLAMTAGYAA